MMNDDEARREQRRKKIADADYSIGFGKTDPETRFKPGKSGNVKGRPKGSKNLSTMVREAAETKEEYVHKGQKSKASRLELGLQQLSLKAAKGDIKALAQLMQLYAQYGPPPQPANDEIDPTADAQAIEEYMAHIAKFKKSDGAQ